MAIFTSKSVSPAVAAHIAEWDWLEPEFDPNFPYGGLGPALRAYYEVYRKSWGIPDTGAALRHMQPQDAMELEPILRDKGDRFLAFVPAWDEKAERFPWEKLIDCGRKTVEKALNWPNMSDFYWNAILLDPWYISTEDVRESIDSSFEHMSWSYANRHSDQTDLAKAISDMEIWLWAQERFPQYGGTYTIPGCPQELQEWFHWCPYSFEGWRQSLPILRRAKRLGLDRSQGMNLASLLRNRPAKMPDWLFLKWAEYAREIEYQEFNSPERVQANGPKALLKRLQNLFSQRLREEGEKGIGGMLAVEPLYDITPNEYSPYEYWVEGEWAHHISEESMGGLSRRKTLHQIAKDTLALDAEICVTSMKKKIHMDRRRNFNCRMVFYGAVSQYYPSDCYSEVSEDGRRYATRDDIKLHHWDEGFLNPKYAKLVRIEYYGLKAPNFRLGVPEIRVNR